MHAVIHIPLEIKKAGRDVQRKRMECKLTDNPGPAGEGVSENLDFSWTSFMNAS